MSIEAMKQALEALEWNLPVIEDWGGKDNLNLQHKAITALRQAIEQAEKQEPVAFVNGYFGGYLTITCFDSTLILPNGLALYRAPVHAVNMKQERVDETAKCEHEPVAYVTIDAALPGDWRKVPSIKWFEKPTRGFLYTAPPKREWVGLTEDEVTDCFLDSSEKGILIEEAIEAKLKEKNT